MRNIALISLHTPTLNNCRGASALPYHLIKFKSNDINLEVWSFNLNGCDEVQIRKTEDELGIKVHTVDIPKWFSFLSNPLLRLVLPKPVLGYLKLPNKTKSEIDDYLSADDSKIWIYGEDIASIANVFSGKNVVITTPDCEAMYYYRVLGMKNIPLDKLALLRYNLMYHRYAKMASQYPSNSRIRYHLVGKADTEFLKKLNPAVSAQFIPHPHYEVNSRELVEIKENEKVKILIAGRYDFYMANAVDEAIEVLINLPKKVKQRYTITFIGKGWEKSNGQLLKAGYESEIKTFVEDYAEELCSHHIQLTPIAVGTGTKGKVLDAFVNGLMVIGTPLALENITVSMGKDCVEYTTPGELKEWLVGLSQESKLITRMAIAGRDSILFHHSREKIADEFFSLFD